MAIYIQQISHYPTSGKGPELRAVLEDWVKSASSRGSAQNLTSQLVSEGPVLIGGIRHESLAAFQSFRERNRANPGFGPFIAKLQSLMARPPRFALFKMMIPPAREAQNPKFLFRVTRYPAAGKGRELGALLEERVKATQSHAFRTLTHQMFGSEGPSFVTQMGFQDMDSLEAFLDNNQRDSAFRAYNDKVQSLVGRIGKLEILQVLVPFPRS